MSSHSVIALDTNVLARLILQDNPGEAQVAADLIAGSACSVGWSVLVELCWVLERSARLPREEVAAGLSLINAIDRITVPDADLLAWAIDRYGRGADFADMIHLASAVGGSVAFACFDRRLKRQAGAEPPLPVQTLKA
jgi:predicted nucleic-acid-binding protein